MSVTWQTPAGTLATITERVITEIVLSATSTVGSITYSIIAGNLPRGLRLTQDRIQGSPTEVRIFTTSRFVIRATDGTDIEDRTFSISVDGADEPVWITREGFLNVGQGENYFVLDNARVDFELEATDSDLVAGDTLEFYISPMAGQLPPGLSLSRDGRISGFTDPIFSIESSNRTGAYDTAGYDITGLDVYQARSNGFDSFFYDTFNYDYNEPSETPRRLSRAYTFVVTVTDGLHDIKRLFRIWVVTEEFLKADNSIVQIDTNLFRADNNSFRIPLWITESDLGRYRANNYVTIYLDVYDPPTLSGSIAYFLLQKNPNGSNSELPPGMVLDTVTGEIAGRVPYQSAITKNYQFTMLAVDFPLALAELNYTLVGDWNSNNTYAVNQAVRYRGLIFICIQEHRNITPQDGPFWILGVATAERTFSVDIIGEIESSVNWISQTDLGSIKPNQPSTLFVEAESLLIGGTVFYEFVSGRLPPGLEFVGNGNIQGKVKQFADSAGPGLTRFFDADNLDISFDTTFDSGNSSFDRQFAFRAKARDTANFAENVKEFFVNVVADSTKTFANLYIKAFQKKEKRMEWFNFITDLTVFKNSEIYRPGDKNFGIQTELRVLVYAGIESANAVRYIQAMSRNHYKKQIQFGDIKSAVAKDPVTQETVFEVIYVDVADSFEKNSVSVSKEIKLSSTIDSKVLVSYENITIDSNIPFVSDSDHQRVFPNSIKNMRSNIKTIGERDREFLPLWMRSIQPGQSVETGYVKALILCYVNPGLAPSVISRIKAKDFDFKKIDFTADRYVIDILDGEIQDKYLAFPQRDILNKLAKPSIDAVTIAPAVIDPPLVIGSFDNDIVTFDSDAFTFDNGSTLDNAINSFDSSSSNFDSNVLTFDQG